MRSRSTTPDSSTQFDNRMFRQPCSVAKGWVHRLTLHLGKKKRGKTGWKTLRERVCSLALKSHILRVVAVCPLS